MLFATKGIIHWQYFNAGVRPDPAQLDGASELADRIDRLEPGSSRVTALRGLVALSRGDPAAASRLLSAALEIEPNDVDSLGILIAIFILTGRNQKARPLIVRLDRQPFGFRRPVTSRMEAHVSSNRECMAKPCASRWREHCGVRRAAR
ncbi:MAG TPA: tetratricopeptide repeat protein [Thermoanaerobaculia bacterium]